jgi:flagellar hook-associated protein 2
MDGLTISGVGSGLDINGIIDSLMGVEQLPLQRLQQKSADYLTQISAYGQLRSDLETFQTSVAKLKSFNDLSALSATSSDESVLTVEAGNNATVGTYDINVDFLAQAQKLGSSVVTDLDTTTIGNAGDQMTFTIGEDSFTVDIGGLTLAEIQTAINDATDNLGVSAGIVQGDANSYYLTLTAEKTGTANAMTLSFTDSGGGSLSDPLGFTETQGASDAQITIDNTYTVVSDSNTITDAIQGLTINLQNTSASSVAVNITRNPGEVSSAVQDFVSAYNNLSSSLSTLQNGDLSGDSAVRLIQRQVRDILGSEATPGGAYSYGFEVGLSFDKEGVLSVNTTTLSDALADNLSAVSDLFADPEQGLATRLDAMISGALNSEGLINAREDGLNASIDSNNTAMERMQLRLSKVEERYRAQFTALDSLVGQLQVTSDYLTTQLASLENLSPSKRSQ